MKRELTRGPIQEIYHYEGGEHIDGPPPRVRGDLTAVRGNLTAVSGDLSGVWGNLSGVWGNLSGVCGDLSGVHGNINNCELSKADRARGVHINDLIQE